MRVMGVDLSSRSYAAVVLGGEPIAEKVRVKETEKDRLKITSVVFNRAVHLLRDVVQPDVVYIEEPVVAGARNLRSSLLIAQICGVMMAACASVGMEAVYLVPVSSWKKGTIDNGSADKQRVRAWLTENHPQTASLCGGDQDLIDAACIALYGQRLQSRVNDIRDELSYGAQFS